MKSNKNDANDAEAVCEMSISRKRIENEGISKVGDFNKFDFKRAGVNFVQVFLLGYVTFVVLLFTWSVTSDYGLEQSIDDFSLDLMISPIFWFVPLLFALILSVLRGMRHEAFDASDPKQLDAYFESQKLKNQPLWFKGVLVIVGLLFILGLLMPAQEVSEATYRWMKSELDSVNKIELDQLFDQIASDGRVMQSEHKLFLNCSLELQFGKKRTCAPQ